MMEVTKREFFANSTKGVHIAVAYLTPAFKFNTQFNSGFSVTNKIVLI